MHDVKALRETPDAFRAGWARRGLADPDGAVARALALDLELRAVQTRLQAAQGRRNEASRLIGRAKAGGDAAGAAALMAEVEALKGELAAGAETEARLAAALGDHLAGLPNLPAAETPDGADESGNVEVRRHGTPRNVPAADHVTLGEGLGLMDFEAARRMSGARFVVLRGALARLERALGQFMLDLQTQENGYVEVAPPLLVRPEAAYGVAHLPKFEADQFWAVSGAVLEAGADPDRLRAERYGLIPTAEVSLTNLVREQLLAEEVLPLRFAALTPCFRSEAGASGRDTRGMIRQHQFWKCELVSIVAPQASAAEHERMTACAEEVLKRLGLPFRTVLLCAGDMGFSARKTFDLEVWLPSQGVYREISSCSNCGDFQARRMDARYRPAGEKGGRFVHTLNGSGLAVGRTVVAVLENYQDEGGRIAVPDVLVPYMGGLRHIGDPA